MELFDIEDNRLVLSPNSLFIPPFKKIWERDKSKGKERAYKEIAYVTFLCNLSKRNPYNEYMDSEKDTKIKKEIMGDINWEPDELVQEAVEQYRDKQKTTNSRLLRSAKSAADKLANYFETVDFSMVDNHGRPVYSARDLASNLKEVGNIVKSLSQLERQVEKEQLESQEARGGSEIGLYEIPNQN